MRQIILIAHNLRSAHNVGSLLRTADGLGVTKVYLTGYTPYPMAENDARLPHIARSSHKKIAKTALGAETTAKTSHMDDINQVIDQLKSDGFVVCALEQSSQSMSLPNYKAAQKVAVIVGREVEGIEAEVLERVDAILEIPMDGKKESFNVAQAAAMVLYHLRFTNNSN